MPVVRKRVTVALVVVVVLGGLFAIASKCRPTPSRARTYARPLLVSPVAYRIGGAPVRDQKIEAMLVELPTHVLVADARANAPMVKPPPSRHRAQVISAELSMINAIWEQLLSALDRWGAARTPQDIDAAEVAMVAAARALDDAFVRLGLAYYIDVQRFDDAHGRHAGVMPFIVENVALVSVGSEQHAVRELRVIGTNRPDAAWGLTFGPHGATPNVNLDAIDREVLDHVLPMLAPGAGYPATGAWAATPSGRALLNTLSTKTREDFMRALGPYAGGAEEVARTLRARDRVIADLPPASREAFAHIGLFAMEGYQGPELTIGANNELLRLDRALARMEAPRVLSRVTSLFAVFASRHEIQHALDHAHPRTTPQRLRDFIPEPPMKGNGFTTTPKDRAWFAWSELTWLASTELSAFLSQLASDPSLTHYGLWTIAAFPLAPPVEGRPEITVAGVLVESLAGQLGIKTPIFGDDDKLDRDRYMTVVEQLLARSNAELQQAATKSYESLFGEPPPIIR